MDIKYKIFGFIKDVLNVENINEEDINENLIELGLDSIKFISLIVTIEDEFDIEIPDNFLLLEEMNTPQKIITIIENLVNR